jgi:hypothetical protein
MCDRIADEEADRTAAPKVIVEGSEEVPWIELGYTPRDPDEVNTELSLEQECAAYLMAARGAGQMLPPMAKVFLADYDRQMRGIGNSSAGPVDNSPTESVGQSALSADNSSTRSAGSSNDNSSIAPAAKSSTADTLEEKRRDAIFVLRAQWLSDFPVRGSSARTSVSHSVSHSAPLHSRKHSAEKGAEAAARKHQRQGWWEVYKLDPTKPHPLKTPRWRDITQRLAIDYHVLGMLRMGASFAFSFNLTPKNQERAQKAPHGAAAWMAARIVKGLEQNFPDQDIPVILKPEFDDDGRIHAHGLIRLDVTDHRTRRKLSAILLAASGYPTQGPQFQCKIDRIPADVFWGSYLSKNLDEESSWFRSRSIRSHAQEIFQKHRDAVLARFPKASDSRAGASKRVALSRPAPARHGDSGSIEAPGARRGALVRAEGAELRRPDDCPMSKVSIDGHSGAPSPAPANDDDDRLAHLCDELPEGPHLPARGAVDLFGPGWETRLTPRQKRQRRERLASLDEQAIRLGLVEGNEGDAA